MRRAQPLYPPAFLIDQNRRIPPNRIAQFACQAAQLIRRFHVPREKDESERVNLAIKGPFPS
jgi:hypothetical protein